MKRRFYFTLLVLAVLVLALPGFAVKGAKRVRQTPLWLTAVWRDARWTRLRPLAGR
jgi:hypothetical protein